MRSCAGTSKIKTPAFQFDNGGFDRDRDWELCRVLSKVFGFAERGFPQPNRSSSKNCRHSMQAHWCQSSFSRNGASFSHFFSNM